VKIRPLRAELFHAGGRMERKTDEKIAMTKLIVAFRNFAKARDEMKKG
jgi:hypothetical protein